LLTHEPTAGLHEVHGLILQRYDQMKGPAGYFGFPITDETVAGNGRYNRFQFLGSAITWHPTFGVHEVHGYIGDEFWSRQGGPTGKGFPISDEYPHGPTNRVSNFFGGDLHYAPSAPGAAPTIANVIGPPGIPSHGDWPATPEDLRIGYCMGQFVERYGMSVNGAAGLVGNLQKESSILPMIIEQSRPGSPMKGLNWHGVQTDFSADEIMLRRGSSKLPRGGPGSRGPRFPGIGLAQWTTEPRRGRLFRHQYQGVVLGRNILFSMDAQIDYVVSELSAGAARWRRVLTVLRDPAVAVEDACDKVARDYLVPGAMIIHDPSTGKDSLRPATDPSVQKELSDRRTRARRSRALYP
jgi:hypothetical protein